MARFGLFFVGAGEEEEEEEEKGPDTCPLLRCNSAASPSPRLPKQAQSRESRNTHLLRVLATHTHRGDRERERERGGR